MILSKITVIFNRVFVKNTLTKEERKGHAKEERRGKKVKKLRVLYLLFSFFIFNFSFVFCMQNANSRPNTGMKTLYTPLDNFFFFKVMGEKGDEVQLLGFINAVLNRTGENRFNSVEILENKTFTGKVKGDKSNTLDIRAVLQDRTRTNI